MSPDVAPATVELDTARHLPVRALTWVLTGFTFVVHAAISLITYATYQNGYDLTIFDQAVRHYARFEAPVATILGQDANLLGEHFSPVMALFAPLYWIWDDPRMLLLGQAAVVALSVPVVVRFARRHAPDGVALLIGLGYAIGWPLQGLTGFDVHEIVFGVLFMALALDALDRRDDRRLLIWSLALLTVREDMGLVITVLGLLRVLQPDRRRRGLLLIGVGLVGYLLVTAAVIPSLSSTGSWRFWSYDALGPDLPSSLLAIVRHPLDALTLFVSPDMKALTLALLLAPGCLIAVRSPYVLVVVPLLAARFWSSRTNLWTPFYHYNAIAWIVLVLAAVHAISLLPADRRAPIARALAMVSVAVALAGTALVPEVFPLGRVVRPVSAEARTAIDQQDDLVARVPAGTCVAGNHAVTSHLVSTNLVGDPTRWDRAPDYLLLDRDPAWAKDLWSVGDRRVWAARLGYTQVLATDRIVMLERSGYSGPSAACRP